MSSSTSRTKGRCEKRFLESPLYVFGKTQSFCQDRLETTIGKPVENQRRFLQGVTITPECFLNGAGCRFGGYNQAVEAVRTTAKASNLLLFAGKQWNFDLPWLLENWPTDPLGNCAASWHPYEFKCRYLSCLNTSAALTAKYPIFVTEWSPGYPQSNHSPAVPDLYSDKMQQWAEDMPGTVSLFPWVWNPGGGSERVNGAESDYTGNAPTAWGAQYKAWLGPGGSARTADNN